MNVLEKEKTAADHLVEDIASFRDDPLGFVNTFSPGAKVTWQNIQDQMPGNLNYWKMWEGISAKGMVQLTKPVQHQVMELGKGL